ncbi:hypothetical protein IT570_03525 [Candidatus Sumerlaeota bacterium]|nr:hypothetical protein [Candidatus Sumerlaeota bacterium]
MTPPTITDRLTRDYIGIAVRIAAAARLLYSVQRDFFVEAASARPPGINLALAGVIRIYVERNLARKQVDLALRELFRVLGDPSASWASIGVSQDDQAELEQGGASFEMVKAAVHEVLVSYATEVLEAASEQMLEISMIVDPPPPVEDDEEDEGGGENNDAPQDPPS